MVPQLFFPGRFSVFFFELYIFSAPYGFGLHIDQIRYLCSRSSHV